MQQCAAAVLSNRELSRGTYLLWLDAPGIAAAVRPGQFITIRCGDHMLRRPFSVHRIEFPPFSVGGKPLARGAIAVLYRVAGSGSRWLAGRLQGDRLDVLGPLGNGFSVDSSAGHVLLLAGGIGVAPLLFLALEVARHRSVTFAYGAGTARDLCHFPGMPSNITLLPCTEDGSLGEKGLVTGVVPRLLKSVDQLFACGPVDMYRSLATGGHRVRSPGCAEPSGEFDQGKLQRCQVSLEVRMGCGVGACYACTILTKRGPRKVCVDGPVFELAGVDWDSVRL